MKTAGQLSADKLRGGFYSPPRLVRVCLDRVAALTSGRDSLRLLEPSAGDGAFVRGLAGHELAARVAGVTAVEVDPAEAAKCRAAFRTAPFPGQVITGSVLHGAEPLPGGYDAAVGNPPFVRFQFVSEQDRQGAATVATAGGLTLGGVANLWIPVLLAALTRLVPGGAFAFIVPAECFTGISAGSVRQWLARHASPLQVDLFPPGSFPAVLQEVVVVSGRVTGQEPAGRPLLQVTEHTLAGPARWVHELTAPAPTWTRYLLTPGQLAALAQAASSPGFRRFSEVARLTVATVTGANGYFSVDDRTLARHGLQQWALPLLPRIRQAPGLVFDERDHQALCQRESRRWLLSFAADLPSPEGSAAPAGYLRQGEERGLHRRYKCRIRTPWYRVPVVRPGSLLLSKRSHRFPRLVVNAAGAVTTDTIYQGSMTAAFAGREADLAAGFHNTVTLLSAELEGRSFGGGVLELVPTEIGRLAVPVAAGLGGSLPRLDAHVRMAGTDAGSLIEETDALLARSLPGLTAELLAVLHGARAALLRRRLDRNG